MISLRSQGWSCPRIARQVGVLVTTTEGLMSRRGLTKKIRPLQLALLRYLYIDKGLSVRQIASAIRFPKSNVEYWMRRHGIAARPLLRYPRLPFDGDTHEMAYAVGLRLGDLYVVRKGHGISVSTTTTHPAMLDLFRRMFGRYGHVLETPCLNRADSRYQ